MRKFMTEGNYRLPKREDHQYIDIENLKKDFQFTYKIAHEMAIRNENVAKTLDLLLHIFVYYERFICLFLERKEFSDNKLQNKLDDIRKDVMKDIKIFYIELMEHYNKIEYLKLLENLNWDNINLKIKTLTNNLTNELYEKYYIIYQHDDSFIKKDYPNLYIPEIYSKRDKHLLKHIEKHFHTTKLEEDSNYSYNFTSGDYFEVFQAINKNNNKISFNTIYPILSTSLRDFSDTQLILNMNLPKEEIIDYIDKIKTDYDKKQSLIKTPLELLIDDHSKKNNDLNIKNTIKLANMFFIYDYYCISKTFEEKTEYEIEDEIQLILTKFHGVSVKKEKEEIRSKKDNLNKTIPYNEYIKDYSETDYLDIDGHSPYLSTKSIRNIYNKMTKYIQEKNPLYKTLINK